jgi:hypothetical protein
MYLKPQHPDCNNTVDWIVQVVHFSNIFEARVLDVIKVAMELQIEVKSK